MTEDKREQKVAKFMVNKEQYNPRDQKDNHVNTRELVNFIKSGDVKSKQKQAVEELDSLIRKIVIPSPPGTAARLIREDRER